MAQQAAALKQPMVAEEPAEMPQAPVPAAPEAEAAAGAEAAAKVVGLHGAFQAPDPGGPNIDLFDNVPV